MDFNKKTDEERDNKELESRETEKDYLKNDNAEVDNTKLDSIAKKSNEGKSRKKDIINKIMIFALGFITCMSMILVGGLVKGQSSEEKVNNQINGELINVIKKYYYNDVDYDKAYEYMRKGLVIGLDDPYAMYFTKEEYEKYMEEIEGEFVGVGIRFMAIGEDAGKIVSVIKGGPAYDAGIKPGDVLVSVDNKKFTDIDNPASLIKGKEGTKVKLTLKSKGEIKEVTLKRAVIKTEKLRVKTFGNTGYIKVLNFDKGCAEEFAKEVSKMESNNVSGLVLDLRGNGGGLVDQAVEMADRLIGEGVVTTIKNKDGNEKSYTSDSNKTTLPMVVLVDGNTASASEILASALQDNNVAKVVGTKTFGKGIIQRMFPLSNEDVVKLTVYEYVSPKGKPIHNKGIKPDFEIKDKKAQLNKALELMT